MGIGYAIVSPNRIPVTCFIIMRQLHLTSSYWWWCMWFLFFVSLWGLSWRLYNFPMSVIVVVMVARLLTSICEVRSKKEMMVERETMRETMRELLSQRIDQAQLKPGDHIYSWRNWYTYAHHGIYGRDGKVIHLTRGEGHKFGLNRVLLHIGRILFSIRAKIVINLTRGDTSSSHLKDNPMNPCSTCGNQSNQGGVCVRSSCMKCFLSGGDLYLFHYNISAVFFLAKLRGGTCTCIPSDPPEKVLDRAESLLPVDCKTSFLVYDLFRNNCEDFAVYCKTGPSVYYKIAHPDIYHQMGPQFRRTMRVSSSSGQAASLLAFAAAVYVVVIVTFSIHVKWGLGIVFLVLLFYCILRLEFDIGESLERERRIIRESIDERFVLVE